MIVRGNTCSEPVGRSMPNALSNASSGLTIASPSANPTMDEKIPTASASKATDAITWRPLAPSDRSRPSSRSR